MAEDHAPPGDDGDQGEDAADGDEGPTADDLHARMVRDQRLVAWLREEGYHADDPALVDAVQRAEAAEQAWRGTKPGVRVSRRLMGAEEALTRAKKAQAKQEQALDDLDRWYEQERDAQVAWLAELRSRTRFREAKLAEIASLAADEFGATRDEADHGSLGEAVDALESDLGPAVRDLIAAAPEGSEVRAKLSGLMGTITQVYNIVTQESRGRWADAYDIGGGDDEMADDQDAWGHNWYHRHHWYDRGGQWGEWRDADQEEADSHQYERMDTGDIQVPGWMRADACHTRWGTRAPKRGRQASHDAWGTQGRRGDDCDGGPGDDHERTAILQAQCQDAAAAAAAHAGAQAAAAAAACAATPTMFDGATAAEEAAAAAAAERLDARRRAVWDQAQEEGVEVAAEVIAAMDGGELEEWARLHLV